MKKLLSIVAPAYNEEDVIKQFYDEVTTILDPIPNYEYEIVIVNDGSQDLTLSKLKELCEQTMRMSCVNLSRNYGHEIAVTAGLDYAKGDVVILMDIDLQDPPSLIPEMLAKYEEGYDVVNAKRKERKGETFLKKYTANLFYRVLYSYSGKVKIPRNVGNFRLISRRALDAYKHIREEHRFTRGLFSWIGFKQTEVEFVRDPRFAGETKYSWTKMINLAIEGLTSFTTAPLRYAFKMGMLVTILSFLYLVFIIIEALRGNPTYVRGWPSLMVVTLFLGGVQLITIGIIGEYVGRIFNETKERPLYCVDFYHESHVHKRNDNYA